MNKRLTMLQNLEASGKADSFALYALAMEYRKEGLSTEALSTFGKLRERDPDYLPMYLMAGQMLVDGGENEKARAWVEAGIDLAAKKGDGKTRSELSNLLETVT
jgi:tetratricopeptide (TPR) repeat protein